MPPRAERAPRTPPERRALQDALAWPIALVLLLGAAIVFFLPTFVPQRFLTLAVGGVFALVTVTLVAILAFVVERWLTRHASTLAQDAERQVQLLGVAGLPAATRDSALIPLASAFADAGARAALRSAEREMSDLLAQLGGDVARAVEQGVAATRTALAASALSRDGAAAHALVSVDDAATALRHVTAAVPVATHAIDLVALARDVVASLPTSGETARITTAIDADRGMVMIDGERMAGHLRELIALAQRASPVEGTVALHISRVFRANIEDTPVRRTGDSRLTIVPRASGDALRAWVQRAQPGAEVLSIVITDAGTAPTVDAQQHAFEPFALSRPGDPMGVTLATVRRTVLAAKGTIWLDGSREGGTAVHLLLPIAVT
jgi:signal transduction histidine kinase